MTIAHVFVWFAAAIGFGALTYKIGSQSGWAKGYQQCFDETDRRSISPDEEPRSLGLKEKI